MSLVLDQGGAESDIVDRLREVDNTGDYVWPPIATAAATAIASLRERVVELESALEAIAEGQSPFDQAIARTALGRVNEQLAREMTK